MALSLPDPGSGMDRVYGCLIAGAVGDALGAPVEGDSYQQIRDSHGKVTELMDHDIAYTEQQPGAVTDDTHLRHYLCYAIVNHGGRITPEEYGKVWVEDLNPDRLWINEELVQLKLKARMNPWTAGKGTIPAGVASMAIEPIGIINAGNPRQAYQDAFNISFVNQDGPNRDAAAAVAAGVAEALSPDATADSVIETITDQCLGGHHTGTFARSLDLTLRLADNCETVDEFVERFYDELLDYTWPAVHWDAESYEAGELFSGNSHEFVPAAIGLLKFHTGDPNETIIEGASFGRDCDTIAKVVGNFVGALEGANKVNIDWIETVETVMEPFFEELEGDPQANFYSMAERMYQALEAEADRAAQREAELRTILE